MSNNLKLPPLVVLVVLLSADHPEVRLHGLAATGRVFLGCEVQLVLGDLGWVLLTSFDHTGNRLEAVASRYLVHRQRGRTVVSVCLLDVDARAVGVLGRSGAVR